MEFSSLTYSILDPDSNYFSMLDVELFWYLKQLVIMFVLQASAFNVNYSDSGLFGIYTISQASDTGEVSCWLEFNY